MLLSTLLGNARTVAANVREEVVGMAPGDAGRYLTGTLAATITRQVVGRPTIRWRFLLVVLIRFPTVKSSAFPATRILVLTVDTDSVWGGSSRPSISIRRCQYV